MNIPDNAVIWRDPNDLLAFHFGSSLRGWLGRSFSLQLDSIRACFGPEVHARAEKLESGKPVPLKDVLG